MAGGTSTSSGWYFRKNKTLGPEAAFFSRALIIFVVIASCIFNLSKADKEVETLWTTLQAMCLGYMLPAPRLPRKTLANLDDVPAPEPSTLPSIDYHSDSSEGEDVVDTGI